jgi:hypothetical protein
MIGSGLLVARRAVAAIVEIAAASLKFPATTAIAASGTAIAIPRAAVAIPVTAATIVAPWRTFIASGKCLGFALRLVAGGTCPRGSEGEAGQEAAQWVGFRITHGADAME